MDSAIKGAINEYLVSADLMTRGFSVYRNMSPTGVTDLIATKRRNDSELMVLFVQVKTGNGRADEREKRQNDILAVVKDSIVRYQVTPGLIEYFSDSLAGKGLMTNKEDSFIVINRPDDTYTSFGRLGMSVTNIDDDFQICLKRGHSKPIMIFDFQTPVGETTESFSEKISIALAEIDAISKTTKELEKNFEYLPDKLGIDYRAEQKAREEWITQQYYKQFGH